MQLLVIKPVLKLIVVFMNISIIISKLQNHKLFKGLCVCECMEKDERLILIKNRWESYLFIGFIFFILLLGAGIQYFLGYNLGIVLLLTFCVECLAIIGMRLKRINQLILDNKK